ncbi:MAG: metallophosphoesterase family protein [Nannocystaceae bacterium]
MATDRGRGRGYGQAQARQPMVRRVPKVVRTAPSGALSLAVISDTHSEPHAAAVGLVRELAPDLILHGGDIGRLSVLDRFEEVAPLVYVRGNIDGRASDMPDLEEIHIRRGDQILLRIMLTHIAVYGVRLQAEARRMAQACDADLVVFGHSHVPFLGRDGRVALFNPGSIGPRRPPLPITLGHIQIGEGGVQFRHLDCETGRVWLPPGMG